jgi:dihydrolipoamide dehydrogenase
MVVGEVATGTDVLVIGGGPGGYAAALRAAALGRSVTLVERDRLGGTCLNVGCIPSKALIEAAHLADAPRTAAGRGVTLTATVDMPGVQRWIDEVVRHLTDGVDGVLRAAGVTVVHGTARFGAARRVAVWGDAAADGQFFEFGSAIVATGSRPLGLGALPVDGERVLDSTGALALDAVPEHLTVVGGGYIGVELGTAWAKLGSRVTIVEAAGTLLWGLPAGLVRVVERSLRANGVRLLLDTEVLGLDGRHLVVASPAGESRLLAGTVVVAVGRRPNTDGLGLDEVGIFPGPGGLVAVDPSRLAGRGVYAIGDITAGPALAHKATAEAEVAATAATGRPAAFDPATIPVVVFSDPEIATIGLTREAATAAGAEARSFTVPLTASGRALTLGRSDGHVELVADGDGTVLGVHLAGPGAGELAATAALAIEMGVSVLDVALTIAPHPTISEALGDAAKGLLSDRRSFR